MVKIAIKLGEWQRMYWWKYMRKKAIHTRTQAYQFEIGKVFFIFYVIYHRDSVESFVVHYIQYI